MYLYSVYLVESNILIELVCVTPCTAHLNQSRRSTTKAGPVMMILYYHVPNVVKIISFEDIVKIKTTFMLRKRTLVSNSIKFLNYIKENLSIHIFVLGLSLLCETPFQMIDRDLDSIRKNIKLISELINSESLNTKKVTPGLRVNCLAYALQTPGINKGGRIRSKLLKGQYRHARFPSAFQAKKVILSCRMPKYVLVHLELHCKVHHEEEKARKNNNEIMGKEKSKRIKINIRYYRNGHKNLK
ncbi:hypothetical protein AGLY_002568 [Aphis glycines]|uniref:Uncharacterized protein n=1 Tax=Aphis glycines TaxID=307491 RepID=A0A6G0U114_APHGL|nr:hypothetical protein AGLY_002568 [Aphis glycines]